MLNHPNIPTISISIFIFVNLLPLAYSDDNAQFLECNRTFNCGTIQGIGYPFWGGPRPRYCGHPGFELTCVDNQFPVLNMNTSQRFRVLNISPQPATMSIAPLDTWQNVCPQPQQVYNISIDQTLFDFASTVRNLSIFFGCPSEDDISSNNSFTCNGFSGSNIHSYYMDESLLRIYRGQLADCNTSIAVPVNQNEFDELWSGNDSVDDAWNKGFDVLYHKGIVPCMACFNSGGVCGSTNTTFEFLCFCRDQPYSRLCLAPGTLD